MAGLAAVTGATGFLGRYIVKALIAAGWQVRTLARHQSEHPQLAGLSFETVLGDISERSRVDALVDGVDIVVHAAGLTKARDEAAFQAVNVGGTAHLVAALNTLATPKYLVLVSSMAAREPHLSPYARSKRDGEAALPLLRPGHSWTIVRPCAIYGAWDREILAFFQAASYRIFPMASPRRSRLTLMHAADAADAIVSLCGRQACGRTFELTDRRIEGYAWDEILATLETTVGTRILRLPLPAAVVRAAATVNTGAAKLMRRTPIFTAGKAREILHADWSSAPERQLPSDLWQPKIGLNDGFRDTVSWYREHRWLSPAKSGPLINSYTG